MKLNKIQANVLESFVNSGRQHLGRGLFSMLDDVERARISDLFDRIMLEINASKTAEELAKLRFGGLPEGAVFMHAHDDPDDDDTPLYMKYTTPDEDEGTYHNAMYLCDVGADDEIFPDTDQHFDDAEEVRLATPAMIEHAKRQLLEYIKKTRADYEKEIEASERIIVLLTGNKA